MQKIENIINIPNWDYTIGQLPTSYLDSMTYQEQLIWLCNYFSQTVAPNINVLNQSFNEMLDSFTALDNNFISLSENVTETLREYDSRITNGLTEIETTLSAQLPSLAESVISDKIQSGDLNCQLGTSYNELTEELTFTIQIVDGD